MTHLDGGDLVKLVENYVSGSDVAVPNVLSDGIIKKEIKLLNVVESLGSSLTNSEKHVRSRGVHLLSETLQRLPRNLLSSQEVEVLVAFYCDRVKDHHSMLPAVLQGMFILSLMGALSDNGALSLVRAIFTEVHVQSQGQADRRRVFSILLHLLNTRLKALQDMEAAGGSFVHGFIQAMDAEKDPRNLILCFQGHRIVASNFPISIFAEDMFEVVACYFPIDFTPPPNDPHGIAKEDLIMGIRRCLGASPLFGEHALPLLLEKFTSSVASAKLDALQTLAVCAEVYDAKVLAEYMESFFYNIRTEFMSAEEPMESVCLNAITSLSKGMSRNVEDEHVLYNFLDAAYKGCERHLVAPELQLMYPNGQILQAAALGSSRAAAKVIAEVLPLLMKQFQDQTQKQHKTKLVDLMLLFLSLGEKFESLNEPDGGLYLHRDNLYSLFTSLLNQEQSQLRSLGTQGLHIMVCLGELLTRNQKEEVVKRLVQILLADKDKSVRESAINASSHIGKRYPDLVVQHILPAIALNTKDGLKMDVNEKLSAFEKLAVSADIIAVIIPTLLDHISLSNTDESFFIHCYPTCGTLHQILLNTVWKNKNTNTSEEQIMKRCLNLAVAGALACKEGPLVKDEVLQVMAKCVRLIATRNSTSSALVDVAEKVFLRRDLSPLEPIVIESNEMFLPLKVRTKWKQTQLIGLFSAIICSMKPEVQINFKAEVFEDLLGVISESGHSSSVRYSCECCAGLINKLQGSELDDQVSSITSKMEEVLSGPNESSKQNVLLLWTHVTKAVVLSGHQSQNLLISKLLSCLEDKNLAPTAANGVRLILERSDWMCEDTHAVVRMMYPQRFYMQTFPVLYKGFTTCSAGTKRFYLLAVSHLLRLIPKQVLSGDFDKLLPLLIQSLSLDDVQLQLSSLSSLVDLMSEDAQRLLPYVSDILPRLLVLSSYKPSMKVRMESLKCIGAIASLPSHVIVPHQAEVVRILGPILDDHKRLVRQQAVQTRNSWYLLQTSPDR